MPTPAPRRGRPRTFDPDLAMNAIVETFRANGYAAASLDELSAATGLSRPSLYAAFGDKHAMYLAAMEAFAKTTGSRAIEALRSGRTIETALTGFYDAMLDAYFSGTEEARGCLVYVTAPSASDHEAVRLKLGFFMDQLDKGMAKNFARLTNLDDKAKIKAAAEAATNTLNGLSTRARSGASKAELKRVARRAAKLIAGSLI